MEIIAYLSLHCLHRQELEDGPVSCFRVVLWQYKPDMQLLQTAVAQALLPGGISMHCRLPEILPVAP